MWSAFSRLGAYLAGHARIGERRVALTFGQLEELLGQPLPPSACTDPAWWGNSPGGKRGRAGWDYRWYGWLSVGWKVEPNLLHGTVIFHRRSEDRAVTPP